MSRKIRVLIFDDAPAVRQLLELALVKQGFDVHVFEDPTYCPTHELDECFCDNNTTCTDIIITDVQMPNLNGMSFLKKQLEKGCQVNPQNVMVISGYLDEPTKQAIDCMGVASLRKPFMLSDIFKWLDECKQRIDLSIDLSDINR